MKIKEAILNTAGNFRIRQEKNYNLLFEGNGHSFIEPIKPLFNKTITRITAETEKRQLHLDTNIVINNDIAYVVYFI